MYRSEVEIMDAIMAVALVESSMQGAALLLPVDLDTLHAPFPKDPLKSYMELSTTILQKLKLYDLLKLEINKIKKFENKNTGKQVRSEYFLTQKSETSTGPEHSLEVLSQLPQNALRSEYFLTQNTKNDQNNILTPQIDQEVIEAGPSNLISDKNINSKNNLENVINTSISQIYQSINQPSTSNFIAKNSDLEVIKINKKDSETENDTKKFENQPKPGPSNIQYMNTKTLNTTKNKNDKTALQTKRNFKSETVKRKNTSKSPKNNKRGKKSLNDAELLNLIPSVNDVFELDELDLNMIVPNSEDIENTETSSQVFNKTLRNKFTFNMKENVLKINEQTTDTDQKENQMNLEINIADSINNELNQNNLDKNVQENKTKTPKVEVKNSLAQFAFKKTPKKQEVCETQKVTGVSDKELSLKSKITVSQTSSKILFQSQDFDVDLDF